jgi:hypothetical protein
VHTSSPCSPATGSPAGLTEITPWGPVGGLSEHGVAQTLAKAAGVDTGNTRSSRPAFAFGLFTWLMHLVRFVRSQAIVS